MANDVTWLKRTDEWIEMQQKSNQRKLKKQLANKKNKKRKQAS